MSHSNMVTKRPFYIAAYNASSRSQRIADGVCSGVNDEVKLASAIAALPSNGGQIVLSEGQFNLSDQTDLVNNLQIFMNPGTLLKLTDNAKNNARIFNGDTLDNVSIIGGVIDGNKAGQTTTIGINMGIAFFDSTRVQVGNCTIKNVGSGGSDPDTDRGYNIYFNGSNDCITNNLNSLYAKTQNFCFYNGSNNCVVQDSFFSESDDRGAVIHNAWDVSFIGCHFKSNGSHGIHLLQDGVGILKNIKITGCESISNTGIGLKIENVDLIAEEILVGNSIISDNTGNGITAAGDKTHISNCIVSANQGTGVVLSGNQNVITGSRFHKNGELAGGGAACGVYCSGNYNSILSSFFDDDGEQANGGIRLSTADYTQIQNNQILQLSSINDDAAGVGCVIANNI